MTDSSIHVHALEVTVDDGLVLANDNDDGADENDGIVLGDDDDAGDRLIDGIDDGAVMNGIENVVLSVEENSPPSAINTPFDVVTL
jgi:hypothetical protein